MKNYMFTLLLLVCSFGFSQKTEGELINVTSSAEAKAKDTTNMGWTKVGNFNVLFNQSAFNNEWQSGGTSNIAGTASVNYDFNYKKKDFRNECWHFMQEDYNIDNVKINDLLK